MMNVVVKLESNGKYWSARCRFPDGSQTVKSLGAKAKVSEAEALKRCGSLEMELRLKPDQVTRGRAPTIASWTTRYLSLRSDLSPATRLIHEQCLAHLAEFLGADRRLDKIKRSDAADFRQWLAQRPGNSIVTEKGPDGKDIRKRVPISETTIAKHIRTAKTIFKAAMDEDAIAFNPFDRQKGTPPRTRPKFRDLTAAQVCALVNAAPDHDWKALIGLCAYAGLRRGEALRLKWEHVLWDRRRLIVQTENGVETTKQRDREVLLVPELETILRAAYDNREERVYVAEPIQWNLNSRLKTIIKRAKMKPWSKPYHTLRKWRATSWRSKYPEHVIDAWLGHSLAVARQHYAAVPEDLYQVEAQPAVEREAIVQAISTLDPKAVVVMLIEAGVLPTPIDSKASSKLSGRSTKTGAKSAILQRAWQDSNLQPSASKADALSN